MFDFLLYLKANPAIAYSVVFLGAMIEGETIIISASALAAIGILSIYKVAALAFVSTLFADQILFLIGHHYYKKPGGTLAERWPRFYKKSEKAVLLLKKYDTLFILMFRFVYGIRAISPVVIALCGCKPIKFMPLNFISALIWTVVSCCAGYWLGDFLFDPESGVANPGNMRKFQYSIVSIILALIIGIFVFKKVKKHLLSYKNESNQIEENFYSSTHSDQNKQSNENKDS